MNVFRCMTVLAAWLGVFGVAWQASCNGATSAASPAGSSQPDTETETAICEVKLADPVAASKLEQVYCVVQSRDPNGFPVAYALSVKTHVCADNKECKMVEVTMHWNALGYFERLECPADKPLTKKEHVEFDARDYAKLDRILKDRHSILGRHSLAFLVEPVPAGQDVDAWTRPTPAAVQEAVVQDAAYTTWVMWRWANGEIVQKLRGLTEQSCTPGYLEHLLRGEDGRCVEFALKYVIEHHPSDVQFLDSVFHALEHGDGEHVSLALGLLNEAVKDKNTLHARLIESCRRMKSAYCPMVLAYFAAEADLPPTTLERLSGPLDRLAYFPVHLTLRLLQQRKFFSEKTESDVSRLLDSDDFFIARRACEYLMKQDVGNETKSKIDAFREQNRDRL